MPSAQSIQVPERLRVLVTLAQLLARLEANVDAVDATQYRSVAQRLTDELGRVPADDVLEALLRLFPATSVLYENLRYEQAGLCRSPLELSLNTELQARAAIERAARRTPA
jgi:hypothetical protein